MCGECECAVCDCCECVRVGICIVLRQFAQHNLSNRWHCPAGPRGVYATFIFSKLFNDFFELSV